MSFTVVASTENNSRIASPFLDGSRPRGRTFRNMVNDLWGVVALESVPLHSTCHKTEPNAHHILVLQHCTVAISFEYFARQKIYIELFSRAIFRTSFATKNLLTTVRQLPVFVRAPWKKKCGNSAPFRRERRGFEGDNHLVEMPLLLKIRAPRE